MQSHVPKPGNPRKLTADLLPIEVPRHHVLELGGDSPIEARPRQLVAGLPLQVRVAQGHADVIQEAGQRTQFDDGILWSEERRLSIFMYVSIFFFFFFYILSIQQSLLLLCL